MLLPAATAVCALAAARCCLLEGAAARGGGPHAETPLKAAKATTTMLLPAAAAVCALAASRCCPLEVLAGISRSPVSLGSSSGCASRACGGRCCARRRAAHGDAAQGYQGYRHSFIYSYQGYDDDAASCGRSSVRARSVAMLST
ncbi:hypothetical protein T492DRAFT_1106639 [Pavlovales sp. CCMP2436]|nr:hypothetical protein T492DRAFT_1106639 [Pavlovales sp. CCMP2436]